MERLLYFFKTHGIHCGFAAQSKKYAIGKRGDVLNHFANVAVYKLSGGDELEHKKSGRPRYILSDAEGIQINAGSQSEFISEFLKIRKVELVEKDLMKEKKQGTALRLLRHKLGLSKKQMAQSIDKSVNTLVRYESGALEIREDTLLMVLTAHKLKLSIYTEILEQELKGSRYSMDDFCTIKNLAKFYEKHGGESMSEFLKVEDIERICRVKEKTAYKIMKKINDKMTQEGYITIRGRVNRKRFEEELGISERGEK